MGLEQVHHLIDVKPKCFPFKIKETLFPSAAWESVQHADFAKEYVHGPRAVLPDIVHPNSRRVKPNTHDARHIWIGDVPVCDVLGPCRGHDELPVIQPFTTETRLCYTPKPLHVADKSFRLGQTRPRDKAVGIVPGTELETSQANDYLFPACNTDARNLMSCKYVKEYDKQKRMGLKPFRDGGVFYSMTTPPLPSQLPHIVPKLEARRFSRKRQGTSPTDTLHVKAFDGGAQSIPFKPAKRRIHTLALKSEALW